MSAIPAVTLICNHDDCTTHAVLIGAANPAEARRAAATQGWTHHHDSDCGHEHDHCPEHSQPPKQPKKKRTLRQKLRDEARDILRRARQAAPLPALAAPSSLTGLCPQVRIAAHASEIASENSSPNPPEHVHRPPHGRDRGVSGVLP